MHGGTDPEALLTKEHKTLLENAADRYPQKILEDKILNDKTERRKKLLRGTKNNFARCAWIKRTRSLPGAQRIVRYSLRKNYRPFRGPKTNRSMLGPNRNHQQCGAKTNPPVARKLKRNCPLRGPKNNFAHCAGIKWTRSLLGAKKNRSGIATKELSPGPRT